MNKQQRKELSKHLETLQTVSGAIESALLNESNEDLQSYLEQCETALNEAIDWLQQATAAP